ncbi:MAG: quinol dehydrogenase ferredoxin subunit NapH [Nitrospirae bacterium]|nr:quinol dehydrogenase ferredoxin subunit NapH [Nitrospirota bacterium]
MGIIRKYRFMILRRSSQLSLMFLFFAGNAYGWSVLKGNLSSSRIMDEVPLSDPFAILQIFAAGSIVSSEALLGALTITTFFAIAGGRVFCSWVCPMNLVTDLANRLRRTFRIDSAGKSWWMSRNTRYWVIGIGLIVSLFMGVAAFEWLSPVSMLHRGVIYGMGAGWAAVLSIFLFDFLVIKNGFCGHICPLGGFYSIIGRFGLFRIRHHKGKCTLCMKCIEICPEKQVLSMVGKKDGMVLSGECTNCGRCIEVCDDNAMKFGMRYISKIT